MIKDRVLVIEDDQDFRRLIVDVFHKENFTTVCAASAEEALKSLEKSVPDIVIMDITLPGKDGLQLCQELKNGPLTGQIPVIMLTNRKTEADLVRGLDQGADDYLTKPFRPRELVARTRAVLRRYRYRAEAEKVICRAEIKIDLGSHCAYRSGKEIKLTPNEFDVLLLLMKKGGEVLSRDFLMQSIWGYEYFGTTRTVDMTVARLRRKLGDSGARIKTVEKIGYVLKEG